MSAPLENTPATASEGRRRGGPQTVFAVQRSERLSPHLVRLHLGGDGFDAFVAQADPAKLATTDKYVKMLFPPRGSTLTPPYDLDALRETLPIEQLPSRRTYTIRSVDLDQRTLAIDFVVHGDEGVAGPWAAAAQPGGLVAFNGPGGAFTPTADDVFRLYLADDSALPAVSAALEHLAHTDQGAGARGIALIEVDSPLDHLPVGAPGGIDVRWLHRSEGATLEGALATLQRPAGEIEVFAHGEREQMKALRRILHDDWGLDRRSMSLSAYWARGRAEDAFQAEKRQPVGQIFEG